jgi:hypothetical protein
MMDQGGHLNTLVLEGGQKIRKKVLHTTGEGRIVFTHMQDAH